MGNALTFILETIAFAAIVRVACRWCNEDPERVSVYGDDIIVPTLAAETARDFLTMLGFRLNESKSFWEGKYRESCGEEYWDGVCVSSIYFPRFAVEGQLGKSPSVSKRTRHDAYTGEVTDTTVRLVQLQHRLFRVSDSAARFLAELIQELHPKMTRSLGYDGSEVPDLWSHVARPRRASSPYAEVVSTFTPYSYPKGTTKGIRHITFKRVQGPEEEGYSVPIPQYPKLKRDEQAEKVYDEYRYLRFLKDGPNYSDDLSRLLHVSDPDSSYDEVFGKPEIRWITSIFVK
jgi:hypothetical protein